MGITSIDDCHGLTGTWFGRDLWGNIPLINIYFHWIYVEAPETRWDWLRQGYLSVFISIPSNTISCDNHRRKPPMSCIHCTTLDDESGDFRLDVITDGLIDFATDATCGNYER